MHVLDPGLTWSSPQCRPPGPTDLGDTTGGRAHPLALHDFTPVHADRGVPPALPTLRFSHRPPFSCRCDPPEGGLPVRVGLADRNRLASPILSFKAAAEVASL